MSKGSSPSRWTWAPGTSASKGMCRRPPGELAGEGAHNDGRHDLVDRLADLGGQRVIHGDGDRKDHERQRKAVVGAGLQ